MSSLSNNLKKPLLPLHLLLMVKKSRKKTLSSLQEQLKKRGLKLGKKTVLKETEETTEKEVKMANLKKEVSTEEREEAEKADAHTTEKEAIRNPTDLNTKKREVKKSKPEIPSLLMTVLATKNHLR